MAEILDQVTSNLGSKHRGHNFMVSYFNPNLDCFVYVGQNKERSKAEQEAKDQKTKKEESKKKAD